MFNHCKVQASMYTVFMWIRLLMINQHSGLKLPKKTLKRVYQGTGGFTSNLNHTSTNRRMNLSDMTHGLVVLALPHSLWDSSREFCRFRSSMSCWCAEFFLLINWMQSAAFFKINALLTWNIMGYTTIQYTILRFLLLID